MTGLTRKQFFRGFTLIEVIVTLGVFSIASLMAVNLFVVFVQQQRRTVVQQELQNDARSAMEQIAQDIHEGNIDYAYYESIYGASGPHPNAHKLFAPLNGLSNVTGDEFLSVLSSTNEQIQYRLNGTTLQRWRTTVPTWQDITPSTLTVQSFTFYITPSENPFAGKAYTLCGNDAGGIPPAASFDEAKCRWGTSCQSTSVANACQYPRGSDAFGAQLCYCYPQTFGSVTPLHPTVTFSMKVQRVAGQQTVQQTFQTTIASRTFSNIERLNDYAK